MKIRIFATLLGIAGIAGLAAPLAAVNESFLLESISATVGANGRVTYQITGHFYSRDRNIGVTSGARGSVIYDPASHQAWEKLVVPGGTIKTSASCLADPWLFAPSCTDS